MANIKGGSRHFDLGGLYNGKSRNLMKIQAPLGGSGGMPPPGNFDIFVL